MSRDLRHRQFFFSSQGRNMAASSKKVFELFVSKVPWTVATSKCVTHAADLLRFLPS